MIASVLSVPAEDWSAIAAWVTSGVALTAGGIALRQLREARRLRLEQAQPYVVVYTADSAAGPWLVDLVIRHFGATAATDVVLEVAPELRRAASASKGETIPVEMPEMLPMLVPGQEWRAFWDTTLARQRSELELPDRYAATVRYKDSHGKRFETRSILDWRAITDRSLVTTYGAHDAAKALRELSKTVKQWREVAGNGLRVYVRDGDARDERMRERREERQREAERARGDADAGAH